MTAPLETVAPLKVVIEADVLWLHRPKHHSRTGYDSSRLQHDQKKYWRTGHHLRLKSVG